ncbi:hypothetical protein NFI96_009975 [Prochilodus magdalenae]|nr:hypothetical protein NFI96_009975 [Prochilodus magdalenae]
MSVLALHEYEFERQFNEDEAIRWMQENWLKLKLTMMQYLQRGTNPTGLITPPQRNGGYARFDPVSRPLLEVQDSELKEEHPCLGVALEHPHTVPADGAVGVEVEGHQVFWTCDDKPFISVLTTVPPHTDSLGVSTKTKAGLVTEDDPLPF